MKRFFLTLGGVFVLITMIVLTSCGKAEPNPSRSEFQQYLLYSAEIEGGRTSFAGMAADAGCPGPAIYDTDGSVKDAAWLMSRYGIVGWECTDVHPDADYVFRLAELRASCGPAIIIVNIKDENGAPLPGRAVVRYWPGAPSLPNYDPPASRYHSQGVVGWTSGNGDVGFGLGTGDYYFPETGSGVTDIWIADYDGPSDLVKNLGMLGGTDHCTVFPVYHRIPKDDVEPPTPTPGPTGTPAPVPEGLLRIEEFYIKLEEAGTPTP